MSTSKISMHHQPLTADQIHHTVGEVDELVAARIIATGATLAQLEEALAWARGESDVIGDLQRPSDAMVGAVYDILTAEEDFPEDRD